MEEKNYYIDTGSTMLNLALTGNIDHGWKLGVVSQVFGDESTGKTYMAMLAMKKFIENPPEGINPKVIYFESENAFSYEYAERLEIPMDKVEVVSGTIIEELKEQIDKVKAEYKEGDGYLLVVDSLDALSCQREVDEQGDKFGSRRIQDKAMVITEMFRLEIKNIADCLMHVMIVSQTRENIGVMFGPKHRTSGGKALKFYLSQAIQLHNAKKIMSEKDKAVQLGTKLKFSVVKNKVSFPYRNAEVDLYFHWGVEDAGSMIDYLASRTSDVSDFLVKNKSHIMYDGKNMRKKQLVSKYYDEPAFRNELRCALQEAWDANNDAVFKEYNFNFVEDDSQPADSNTK